MVTRDIFTHDVSFHCCQGQGYHNIYAELNSTCAEVTSIRKQDSRIYFCNLGEEIIYENPLENSLQAWYYDYTKKAPTPKWMLQVYSDIVLTDTAYPVGQTG